MQQKQNINPLIALAGNLLLDVLGIKQNTVDGSVVPELAEIPCITGLRRKAGAVILLIGARETGNTTEGLRLAEIIGRPTYGIFPEQKPPSWVTPLTLKQLDKEPPPFSTLFCDDAPIYAGNRDYHKSEVQFLEKMIPVCRHLRKIILIFRVQTSGQADRWMMDADLVSFRELNPLWGETERSSVLRLYKQIQPEFLKMSEHQKLRHCYLVHKSWQGWARIDLPNMQ